MILILFCILNANHEVVKKKKMSSIEVVTVMTWLQSGNILWTIQKQEANEPHRATIYTIKSVSWSKIQNI